MSALARERRSEYKRKKREGRRRMRLARAGGRGESEKRWR